ncbi:enoyl-CoA hydratase/isomerase family protein [Pseudomonas sp. FME51]|uniref:enoyl-CoA hydratase/isomerase family protein n=1 Tax=Pseudomonas sp. FME51 TaxID=2742609 RepID=UPI001865BB3E|nr:enoyl-CoA hydratase-related protein [Pseudomonas sp. FME51]
MSDLPLTVEQSGKFVQLQFNRPTSLNAIDSAMAGAFLQAVTEAVADERIRVIILSGAGRSFMAGGDIAQFSRDPESIPEGLIEPMNQAIQLLNASDKIVLGSVQGPVAGAGMSLALACDLLIAADNTRFSFAYTALAASGDLGITWTLPRLLGLRNALAVALLGDSIKADEAQRLGLVNRVVEAEQLAEQTLNLANQLAELPALASASIKRLMQAALQQDLCSQLAAEKQAFSQCIEQPEFHAAVARFLVKRR